MGGLFMPDDYVYAEPKIGDIKIVSIAWGFQLGFTILTAAKAATQTLKIWRRTGRVTLYMFMIWAEISVNSALGVSCYLFLDGTVPPSFAFYIGIVTLWSLELHLLIQIICNRLALLIPSQRRASWIKWSSFGIILFLNIGVYCIWIPSHLQISKTYYDINQVWDRTEKVIYLILDGALNFYFCYLVKTRLVTAGMTKYESLYKFNVSIVFVSLSMDVLLIGMMSLPNEMVYTVFHPVTFMVKLNIEMSMAHMISKIARAPGQGVSYSGERSAAIDMKLSDIANDSKGTKNSHSKIRSLNGSTFVSNGTVGTLPGNRERKRFDPTISEILSEDRVASPQGQNSDRLYHAWVSGGHDANPRGRSHDSDSDVEAGISVLGQSRLSGDHSNHIRKNTTVQVTTESIHMDEEVGVERNRSAPSESDSIKALTKHGS